MTTLRERILGCWLGKCIGGTLGAPIEGQPGPHSLTFYDPVPDRMLPNDDLDLQVVWLEKLRETGGIVSARILADAWREHVDFHPDEYGIALRNLYKGLPPPFSGAFDNPFRDGMGCAIRTELWACLAPGDPARAVALAEADGCVDHVGDGLDAARFIAALQSLAFVEQDRDKLLDAALGFIPSDGRLAAAIRDARAAWAETGDWAESRRRIVEKHRVENWTDVCQNLAFVVLGWSSGGGDFGKSLCDAVNCGGDSDCTGATLGALLGILAPDGIPAKWSAPIGRGIVLSPGIVGMHPPADLDAMTDELLALTPKVVLLKTPPSPTSAIVSDSPLRIEVVYPPRGAFFSGEKTPLRLSVANPGKAPFEGTLSISAPLGWSLSGVAPSSPLALSLSPGESAEFELGITAPGADAARPCRNPLVLRFESGAIAWTESVGLPLSIPCLLNGEPSELPTHDIPLQADAETRFAVRFVVPARAVYRIVLCAPAHVSFTVDGTAACDDSSCGVVSAIHRPTGAHADVSLAPGAHLLEAKIGPASGNIGLASGNIGPDSKKIGTALGDNGASSSARLSIGEPSTWRLVSNLEYLPV